MSESLIKVFKDNALYFDEKHRRATYRTWIFDENVPCSADKVAEAGFIFIGNKKELDSVQCFMCNKSLDGWEKDDDPWKEHLKHSPNCPFAKLQKSQDLSTLEELLNLKQIYEKSIIDTYFVDLKKSVFKDLDRLSDK